MKKAVLLLNMGGPSSREEVKPFLFRLFNDPHILRAPFWLRPILAYCLASWRRKTAEEIYKKIGGKSPVLENTKEQAIFLQEILGDAYQTFIGMNYAAPLIKKTILDIKQNSIYDEIILVSLYPQFSITTSASVLFYAKKEIRKQMGDIKIKEITDFATMGGYIKSLADNLSEELSKAYKMGDVDILFSAHGLPEKIIAQGDVYPFQCQQTVTAIADYLSLPKRKYRLCYQSRLGPVKWISPFIEDEINRAAKEGKAIVVVPISFACENSETIYELDIQYREKALQQGACYWGRVATPSCNQAFLEGLAQEIKVNGG